MSGAGTAHPPGSPTLSLAGAAQNPFNAVFTEATLSELRLSPRGTLTHHLDSREPALKKLKIGALPLGQMWGGGWGPDNADIAC